MDTLPTSSSLVSRFTVLPATTPKRVSWDFAIETIVHFNYLSKMVSIHSYVKLPEGIMNKCDHLWRMNIQENAWQFSCSRPSRTIFWLKSIGIQSPKSKMNSAGVVFQGKSTGKPSIFPRFLWASRFQFFVTPIQWDWGSGERLAKSSHRSSESTTKP